MTESIIEQLQTEQGGRQEEKDERSPYEKMRDSIPHSGVREMWRAGDVDAHTARTEMQKVHDDQSLTEEGKQEAAQRVVDWHGAKARQHYQDAREKAEEAAKSAYEFSIPMPDKQSYATSRAKDATELRAIQGEANDISERISGMSLQAMTKAVSRNPKDKGIQGGDTKLKILREEYADAMRRGGLEGKVKAHAVLRVADTLAIATDEIVDDFRDDRHRRYVQESEEINTLRASIPSGSDVTQNPYDKVGFGGAKRRGTYGKANHTMLKGGRPQLFGNQRRRRPWK